MSVVVPTCQGSRWLPDCLVSLARQTLDPARFEVVVAQNGPPDDTAAVLDHLADAHPRLAVRRVETRAAGVALGLNLGIDAARGRYVTFVGDDDWVSPEYLEVLLAHSSPGVVGHALIADVAEPSGWPDFDTGYNRTLLRFAGRTVPAHRLPGLLGFAVCKLLGTCVARAVRFDESLRTGEDVDFWSRVHAATLPDFRICPVEANAVYYRRVRAGSLSRPAPSFDFGVGQRLDVIERLQVLRESALPEVRAAARHLQLGQANHTTRFLRERPGEYRRTLAEYRRRAPADLEVAMRTGAARNVAVLYAAPPYADTSANVAARRVSAAGLLTDVVSGDMSEIFACDDSLERLWPDVVDHRSQTPTRATYAWWPGIAAFVRRGLAQIEAWERDRGPYLTMYSRAVWLHAHLLAACHKGRRPGVRWTAEFSDPLLRGIRNEQRESSGAMDEPLREELAGCLAAAGFAAPGDGNAYRWAEVVALALADEIVFTNPQQREFMLGYQHDPALAERAAAVSRVDPHPVPDAALYRQVESTYRLDPGRVHIGYFGRFYATRGLDEVAQALRDLPNHARDRLRLHVFTADPETLAGSVPDLVRQGVLVPNAARGYLECLNLSTRMDVLLINDTDTARTHPVNPYLPSKLADYAGSGRPVWGVVEEGSMLSRAPLAHRSELGDAAGAARVLSVLADRAAAGAQCTSSGPKAL